MGTTGNTLNIWVKPTATQNWTIKNWWHWFRKQIKFSYQRITRGWADCDTWDLDFTIAQYLSETIHYLADHSQGHPHELEPEEWRKIQHEMADKIGAYNAELETERRYNEEVYEPYIMKNLNPPKELTQKFIQMEQQEKLKQMQSLSEGLDLMITYYTHLWD